MDISRVFWEFVDIVSSMPTDDIKNHRLYQIFESASCLNRKFFVNESSIIRAALVGRYPKGIEYDYCDEYYIFRNIYSLFYGSTEMLMKSVDFKNNKDAQIKCELLQGAIKALENNGLMNELTEHLVRNNRI